MTILRKPKRAMNSISKIMENNQHNLTDKQQRFCEEYMVDLNATQAAIRAGYSEQTAATIGCENLIKPNIQNYIQQLQKEIRERNEATVDECVMLLTNIIRFDIAELYNDDVTIKDPKEIPDSIRNAIEEVHIYSKKSKKGKVKGNTKKIRSYNKLNAVEKLMRYLGAFEKDNSQNNPDNMVIIQIPDNGRG